MYYHIHSKHCRYTNIHKRQHFLDGFDTKVTLLVEKVPFGAVNGRGHVCKAACSRWFQSGAVNGKAMYVKRPVVGSSRPQLNDQLDHLIRMYFVAKLITM